MVDVRHLMWDPGNVAHIARHSVTSTEVEEVCYGQHISRGAYAGRTMLIGRTAAGKVLAVILDLRGDRTYYPVTARPASRRERRQFAAATGAGEAT